MIEKVVTKSFEMEYFKFGEGERVLVILPGISVQSVMLSADFIERSYRALSKDFTVYVFDRRKELPASYSLDDMARDAFEGIMSAGITRASILGASQGAMMAIKIASKNPSLVEKLVLASGTDYITDKAGKIIQNWIDLAKREKAEELYLSFGEKIYPPALFEGAKGILKDTAKSVKSADLRRFVTLASSAMGYDGREDLEEIACKALVLGDTDDKIFGIDGAENIAKRLKGKAELHIYSGYGHALYDTAPDFKERILRFLIK